MGSPKIVKMEQYCTVLTGRLIKLKKNFLILQKRALLRCKRHQVKEMQGIMLHGILHINPMILLLQQVDLAQNKN